MSSKEDIKLFLSEAEDLINKVEDEILILEENPGSTKPIQELYFAFHTLKGLTAMVGLENVAKFCHNFENLLDKTKESKLTKKRSKEIVNLMFESLDVLRSVLKNVKQGKIQDIDDSIVSDLKESFEYVESEYEITFIKQIPPGQVEAIIDDKRNIFYKISIRLQSTCVFKKVRLFIIFRALNDIGQICWSNPEPNILESGQFDFDFEINFLSRKSINEITKILDEILEIENKVIKKMSSSEFKDILTKSTTALKRPVKISRDLIEAESIEKQIISGEVESVSRIVSDFEDESGQITSVKVNIETLEELMDYFGEVIIIKNQLSQILKERQDWSVTRFFDNMDKLFLEIQEIIFGLKLVRVETVFRRYRRLVRDIAKDTNKNIKFTLEGMDVEIDRKILEELNGPLIHLLRNSIYHGIESLSERRAQVKPEFGSITLKTYRRAGSVSIQVEDDGRGINYEKIRTKAVELGYYSPDEVMELSREDLNKLLFTPGFSTLSSAGLISGRGMGLAIVTEKVKELGGVVSLESVQGKGTKFTLTVPFSRAILKAQLFKVSGDLFAIPIENIHQIYFFNRELIDYVKGEEYYRIDSDLVPILRLNKFLDLIGQDIEEIALNKGLNPEGEKEQKDAKEQEQKQEQELKKADSRDKIAIYVNKDEQNPVIIVVDEIIHQMDVVIKPFRSKYSSFQNVLGVTITGDGSICIILDVTNILSSVGKDLSALKSIEASH